LQVQFSANESCRKLDPPRWLKPATYSIFTSTLHSQVQRSVAFLEE
jgi:hypothetical protein